MNKLGDGIPDTGVKYLDELAVDNTKKFDRFMNLLDRQGIKARAVKGLPERATFKLKKGTFIYDPDRFTNLDMVHEYIHLRQLRSFSKGTIPNKAQIRLFEIDAYRFERTVVGQRGGRLRYLDWAEDRIKSYGGTP